MTALAEHRVSHLQERRQIRAMRGVAIGAIIDNRSVLPEEGSALFRMTRVAGLVDRDLLEQRGAVRTVRIMTVGTRHLAGRDRVGREAFNLCPLSFMASKTDFGLRRLVEYPLVRGV